MFSIDVGADASLLRLKGNKKSLKKKKLAIWIIYKKKCAWKICGREKSLGKNTGHVKNLNKQDLKKRQWEKPEKNIYNKKKGLKKAWEKTLAIWKNGHMKNGKKAMWKTEKRPYKKPEQNWP